MECLQAAVFAADPLTNAGLVALLHEFGGITVLEGELVRQAEVAFIVTRTVDTETLSLLSAVTRATTAHIVLVVGKLRESDLPVLLSSRIHRVLDHATLSSIDLVEAAFAARRADDVLRRYDEAQRAARLRDQYHFVNDDAEERHRFTPREIAVLRLLADGVSTHEVATRLSFSVRTVRNIIAQMMTRVGLTNRSHAVARAIRLQAI
ncbi:helix-turn-helix transcriptional regulator [Lentzea sp. NBRC 102530]|uniref:helix-turn-helix transcriptional regulator n=1 Tax=Lentzea sp. NBRC 102530 TaxID=3032201 RepID=UPI0024A2265A|nr:helix-turn-helix transcriptional regulator [Lentzea sp. NBRC 102530]GLY46837.1 helix-turn-helix transcriptional regulator [Lentzea sp. NBRC 102530]